MIAIRAYEPEDAATSLQVFLRAIRGTASADYTDAQIAAWAPDDLDVTTWHEARSRPTTLVAADGSRIAGFTQIDDSGYVDMMFVDPEAGRRGVASALLAAAVAHVRPRGARTVTTEASVTARPFFAAHGFTVDAEQQPVRRGVTLTNYRMSRGIDLPD